jgi:hypothetical protein
VEGYNRAVVQDSLKGLDVFVVVMIDRYVRAPRPARNLPVRLCANLYIRQRLRLIRTLARQLVIAQLALALCASFAAADGITIVIAPKWDDVIATSNASTTIHMCVYPQLRRESPLHNKIFSAVRNLGADYPRYQAWYPYPRLSVAELRPPRDQKTYWDFTLMDPIIEDFMDATDGRPVVVNFATLPAWMFTGTPLSPPDDPNKVDWDYGAESGPNTGFFVAPGGQKRQLTEETIKLIAEYQGRVAGWYIIGGFHDEYGVWHASGHKYKFAYWEVLNEPNYEHSISPQDYVRVYDAVVQEVRKVAPDMKFIGLAVAGADLEYFEYFLNPANHKPGVSLDMISYHLYTRADLDETPDRQQYSIFRQVDHFLIAAQQINAIRDRLSPETRIAVNELGSLYPAFLAPKLVAPIPRAYWNLAGAMSAYAYGRLASAGVDIVGQAELIDYPGQTASTTLIDWDTGEPNARYWVVRLLRESFGPGDKLVSRPMANPAFEIDPAYQLYYQGFITPQSQRRILLVNKRDHAVVVKIAGAAGASVRVVDDSTEAFPQARELSDGSLKLEGFAVAVITLKSDGMARIRNTQD